MKVLVFTAKWIGLHCVEFLLDHYPEDEYLFVVMEPDAGLIAKRLTERQVPFVHLSNESLHEIQQRFGEHHFDFLLNLWGGHIFRRETLRLARRSLNIHPAYLPYCRGRDPVVWAVRYGYPAGVTLHEIADGVDEGPILRREEVPYSFPTTGGELYARVIDRSWRLFCEEWPTLRQGEWKPLPQQPLPEQRTFRRAELLSDRTIDSRKEPEALTFVQRVLAHDFGDYTAEFEYQEKIYSLRVVLEEKTAK